MQDLSFLQQSLRIRYEALSNFATAVSRANTLQEVGQTLTVHVKYVLDVYIIRFYYEFAASAQVLEVFRGNADWKEVQQDNPMVQLEQQLLAQGIPRYVQAEALKAITVLQGSIFDQDRVKSIYTLPLILADDHKLVMTIASKANDPYTDPDFRFIRLIAELLSNKLSQLLLLQNIENKNNELAEVNDELQTLNEEIKRLNLYLEEKVEERTTALQKANEELNTIFYRTSHDFRRPLTTILGLANVARHITQNPEVLSLFGYAETAVGDLNRMLEKLKDLSHLGSNDEEIVFTDFEAIIAQVERRFHSLIEEKHVSIRIENSLQLPFYAPGGVVYAILENLLENSILFGKAAPIIDIGISMAENLLVLEVSDNGQGIPEGYKRRVFDMYVCANEGTKGNGLGLYVVKKLVESLAGKIELKSTLGEGTTIKMYLPLKQQKSSL